MSYEIWIYPLDLFIGPIWLVLLYYITYQYWMYDNPIAELLNIVKLVKYKQFPTYRLYCMPSQQKRRIFLCLSHDSFSIFTLCAEVFWGTFSSKTLDKRAWVGLEACEDCHTANWMTCANVKHVKLMHCKWVSHLQCMSFGAIIGLFSLNLSI